ncbi:MAG: hypothetical protein WCE68_06430 [Anaerolineales bacterium]
MNRQNCIEIIYSECTSMDGFLVKLRSREFSKNQYESLLNALSEFRELIRGQDYIERKVTYCLYNLDIALTGALKVYSRTEIEKGLIQSAHQEFSKLIIDILTPESLIGNK